MEPRCIRCGGELSLIRDKLKHYAWVCQDDAHVTINTGVPTEAPISPFESCGIHDNGVNFGVFGSELTSEIIPGALVYMPQILYHFIQCHWGACYTSIHKNLLIPYLESSDVLDYVLKTRVIQGGVEGKTGAHIYGELYRFLHQVESMEIHEYLSTNFPKFTDHITE